MKGVGEIETILAPLKAKQFPEWDERHLLDLTKNFLDTAASSETDRTEKLRKIFQDTESYQQHNAVHKPRLSITFDQILPEMQRIINDAAKKDAARAAHEGVGHEEARNEGRSK